MAKKKFPTLAAILFVYSLMWILNETGIINLHLPWIPTALLIVSVGMIINKFSK